MSVESTSLMSRNFVSYDSNESKYQKAREAASQARGQMSNRQNSILAAGIAACATCDSMAERILEGKKAARRMAMDMQQNVSEKSKETLDKLKDKIEENGEKAQDDTEINNQSGIKMDKKEINREGQIPASTQAPASSEINQPSIELNTQAIPGGIDIEV